MLYLKNIFIKLYIKCLYVNSYWYSIGWWILNVWYLKSPTKECISWCTNKLCFSFTEDILKHVFVKVAECKFSIILTAEDNVMTETSKRQKVRDEFLKDVVKWKLQLKQVCVKPIYNHLFYCAILTVTMWNPLLIMGKSESLASLFCAF